MRWLRFFFILMHIGRRFSYLEKFTCDFMYHCKYNNNNKKRANSTKTRFSNSCSNKKNGPGEIIRKMEKNSLHSSMRHLALTCCIILQSTINLFQMVTQKQARNEVKIWIRGHN